MGIQSLRTSARVKPQGASRSPSGQDLPSGRRRPMAVLFVQKGWGKSAISPSLTLMRLCHYIGRVLGEDMV